MLAVRGGITQTFKELEFVTNLLLAGTIIFVSLLLFLIRSRLSANNADLAFRVEDQ